MWSLSLHEARKPDRVIRTIVDGSQKIWWDISGSSEALPSPLAVHDLAVTACIFKAMRSGQNVHIDGPVSRSLLENIEDFVACWHVWKPRLYQKVKVTASEEVPDRNLTSLAEDAAVAAFSGGLDASFTLWRHVKSRVGRRSRKVQNAVLIQGLDIPLSDNQAFDIASRQAAESVHSVDVAFATLRTNWKLAYCGNWELEFGAALVSCLANWSSSVGNALIGSDEDYSNLVLPWGSNPISNPMLSASNFKIVYDGGEHTRTEKAAGIADWETGLNNLRVCWAGPVTGQNCGRCEKCLRTKMNFLAVGARLPRSLAEQPTPSQIFKMRAFNDVQISYLRDIVKVAEGNGIGAPWLTALKASILKNRAITVVRDAPGIRGARRASKRLLPVRQATSISPYGIELEELNYSKSP